MRVLLDATALPPDRRGVGRYLDSLAPALVRGGVDLRVVCKPSDAGHFAELTGTDPVPAWSGTESRPSRLLWEQVGLPRLVRSVGAQVLHSPHYTHPVATRAPLVVTLHDATFFTDPEVHTGVKGPFFRTATRRSLTRAAVCVVPSRATADELVRVAGADPDRMVVAYHGVDHEVFDRPAPEAVQALRAQLGVGDYIAFLGTLEPRKNVPALIEAWSRVCVDRADPPALVLAGGQGWHDEALTHAVAAVPARLHLVRPGYLPLTDLPALLGGAQVVAYPSLGEGFGLPVLEAMACAAPVLTTRRLALPEVGGDAVAYCDVDAASIADALAGLLDDPQQRARLAADGYARAAGFTWDACAAAHVEAYEQALARSGRAR